MRFNCWHRCGLLGVVILGISALSMHAQLAVTVSPPKVIEQKAVVKLELKNHFSEKIESARAVCFLLDEQGQVQGQPVTRWVIGGTAPGGNVPEAGPGSGLAPGMTNTFHFVITSPDASGFTSTNLTAKVQFSRLVLEGGKLADPAKAVQVRTAAE